ncbi:MAG: hypothetical protein K2G49_12410 [Muribaculum sp.]|nr:hypothetical protein [Muribaculum sp.]
MEPSESDRDNLISKAIDILRIAQKNIDKSDYYTCFVNDTYDLFTKKYNISKEDARILKDYTTTLYSQCEKLDGCNLEQYAKDLDKVIDDSDLDMEEKLAITSVSKISINSYLCWKD